MRNVIIAALALALSGCTSSGTSLSASAAPSSLGASSLAPLANDQPPPGEIWCGKGVDLAGWFITGRTLTPPAGQASQCLAQLTVPTAHDALRLTETTKAGVVEVDGRIQSTAELGSSISKDNRFVALGVIFVPGGTYRIQISTLDGQMLAAGEFTVADASPS